VLAQRRDQPQLIEFGWPQLAQKAADVGDDVLDLVLQPVQSCSGRGWFSLKQSVLARPAAATMPPKATPSLDRGAAGAQEYLGLAQAVQVGGGRCRVGPNMRGPASPRSPSGGRQRPPGTSRPRPIQGHTPRPSGIPPSRRRRTQPAQALARQRLGGARSGRWGPSACTVRRYRPPEPSASEIACRRSAARPPGVLASTPEVGCWGLMRHPGANRAGSWRAACLP
jgi:hypothetical protein